MTRKQFTVARAKVKLTLARLRKANCDNFRIPDQRLLGMAHAVNLLERILR